MKGFWIHILSKKNEKKKEVNPKVKITFRPDYWNAEFCLNRKELNDSMSNRSCHCTQVSEVLELLNPKTAFGSAVNHILGLS